MAVKNALITGALTRQNCWCGAEAQAHHEDYDKPLEVVWLCPIHHGERHRELHVIERELYGVTPRRPKIGG